MIRRLLEGKQAYHERPFHKQAYHEVTYHEPPFHKLTCLHGVVGHLAD